MGGQAFATDRQGTFVETDSIAASGRTSSASEVHPDGASMPGPGIQVGSAVECEPSGSGSTCGPIEVLSVGTEDLQVTSLELEGPNVAGFDYSGDCSSVVSGSSCSLLVTIYSAVDEGEFDAVLVINQNLPGPPTYVTLSGAASCTTESSNGDDCGGVTTGSSPSVPSTPGVSDRVPVSTSSEDDLVPEP